MAAASRTHPDLSLKALMRGLTARGEPISPMATAALTRTGNSSFFRTPSQGFDGPGRLHFAQGRDCTGPDTFLLVLQEIKESRHCHRVPEAPKAFAAAARTLGDSSFKAANKGLMALGDLISASASAALNRTLGSSSLQGADEDLFDLGRLHPGQRRR